MDSEFHSYLGGFMKGLLFFFSILKENWKSYSFPLFMSIYIPTLAFFFGQLTFFVAFGSIFIILSCIMGMVDRDVGQSFSVVIRAQQTAITSIYKEIQKAKKKVKEEEEKVSAKVQ